MHKIKVRLDTQSDISEFVGLATGITESIVIEDGNGLVVNGKSLMGVMYGKMEFNELWVKSDYEHLATRFRKFLSE